VDEDLLDLGPEALTVDWTVEYRAMIHEVFAPGMHKRAYYHRYTDDNVDLCDVLSSFSYGAKVKLDELSRIMGLAHSPIATSSSATYVVKDLEIGKPVNSNKCSEAAEGVARVKSCPRAECGKSACPVRWSKHLASMIHCVDDEIIGSLQRREQRRRARAVMPHSNPGGD
jgi:hypothetical protein